VDPCWGPLGHKELANLDITSHVGLVIEEQSFLRDRRKGTFRCAAELQNANPEKLLFKQEYLLNTQQLKRKFKKSNFSSKNCMGHSPKMEQ